MSSSTDQKPRRILSTAEVYRRLSIGRTAFHDNFLRTGRLRKIKITAKRIGFLEADIDALIEELAAQREAAPANIPEQTPGPVRRRRRVSEAAG